VSRAKSAKGAKVKFKKKGGMGGAFASLAYLARGNFFSPSPPFDLGTVTLAHERCAREQSRREGTALVLAQIVKGVQFASSARDGDTTFEIFQVIRIDIVIRKLARVVESAERYCSGHLISLLPGFGRMLLKIPISTVALPKWSKAVYWTLVQ
jgi:hypothetical protein